MICWALHHFVTVASMLAEGISMRLARFKSTSQCCGSLRSKASSMCACGTISDLSTLDSTSVPVADESGRVRDGFDKSRRFAARTALDKRRGRCSFPSLLGKELEGRFCLHLGDNFAEAFRIIKRYRADRPGRPFWITFNSPSSTNFSMQRWTVRLVTFAAWARVASDGQHVPLSRPLKRTNDARAIRTARAEHRDFDLFPINSRISWGL